MNILKKIGVCLEKSAQKIEEKNRYAAQINRIRGLMKREQKAAEREYITLGRYYYQNLRKAENTVTEKHCAELDQINKRLNIAIDQLEKTYYEIAKAKQEQTEEISLEDVREMNAEEISTFDEENGTQE